MFGNQRQREAKERLDGLGRRIVRASARNEAEAEAAGASPFLYARLRARITAEREGREQRESWLTLLGVVWRAVPAMALIAVFAVGLFLSAGTGAADGLSDGELVGSTDTGVERVFFAEQYPLSSDEVLTTIMNDDERETLR